MARKRRGPTLLELIREPPPGGSFRMGAGGAHANGDGGRAAYAPKIPGSGGLSWWQMGARTLRIPVGYVIVAAGLALALAVMGYLVGYNRGESDTKAQHARSVQAQLDMVDPLNIPSGTGSPAGSGSPTTSSPPPPVQQASNRPSGATTPGGANAGQQAGAGGAGGPGGPGGSPTGGASNLERDPRVPGMNYWVIARLGPDEARRAAAYLQANGVGVAVIETNSDKFREVIASGGFEGSGSSPDAARIKARVLELGRLYRVQEKGPTDFSDMYARKFSGR